MENDPVKRLAEVAAAYGADSSKWPADERALLKEAASANPEILAEAREVDRLLSLAAMPPEASSARSRLVSRLNDRRQASTSNIVPMRRRQTYSPGWSIAAALAASLACGVYLGSLESANDLFDPGVNANDDNPVDLAGLGDVSDYIGEDRS